MKKYFVLIIITYCCFYSSITFAQALEDTSYYRIETIDGNTFIGRIVDENPESISLLTESIGEVTILKRNIRSRTLLHVSQIKDGVIWFDNPQATRYFWQPNGYGLKKGEGYYQNVWILFNQASYGITNNISVGGGILPAFFFGGASTPVWITPKFSVPVVENQLNIGAGALFGTVLGEPNSGFGILYGISTIGSRDNNLSLGFGWGYTGENGLSNVPTISFSGMARAGAKSYLLTENYFLGLGEGSNVTLISLGGRQIIRQVGLDYGAIIPIVSDMDTFLLVPWLGITVPFGNVVDTRYARR